MPELVAQLQLMQVQTSEEMHRSLRDLQDAQRHSKQVTLERMLEMQANSLSAVDSGSREVLAHFTDSLAVLKAEFRELRADLKL